MLWSSKVREDMIFFLNISLSIGVLHGILSLVENGSKGLSAGLSMWHDAWLKMVP